MPTSRRSAVALAALVASALAAACPSPPLAAEVVDLSDVDVVGHESLTRGEVAGILAPDGRALLEETALAARADSLLARLSELGRPFARVRVEWTEGEEGATLAVELDEGPAAVVSSISFDVDAAPPHAQWPEGGRPSPVEAAGLATGQRLTEDLVEREISAALDSYQESGRPFARVSLSGVSLAPDGGFDLRLAVDRGADVRFGRLAVRGNSSTRPRVIERESGILPGAPYRASAVEGVRSKLERLGFFASVSEPVVSVDRLTGIATVGVEVEEGRTSRIEGALGYSPGGDDSESVVTGLLDIDLGNIAGTGRSVAARWERLRSEYTRIAFSYEEPWLLGAPIDVGVRGEQTVNDTIYTTTEGDLLVTARMGDRTRVTWAVGAERYVPGVPGESTTTSYRTSMSGVYDATDVPGNPTAGTILEGTVVYSAKKGEAGERNRSGTGVLRAEVFASTSANQVLALRAEASAIASTEDEIPFHELLVLGGASGPRGYREEQFRGTRTALGSVEYRFLLSRRSRVLAFVDAGYYYRSGSNPAKDIKLGYGIGLRGETRLGIIAVDYGLGEGDGLLEGKLHVGLTREF